MKSGERINSLDHASVQVKIRKAAPYEEGKPFDGARMHALGYTDFKPGVTYIVYEALPNTGGLRPVVIFPHDGIDIESGHYTCTFIDRYMELMPAARYYHPHHFPFKWLNPALVKNARNLAARKQMTRIDSQEK